MVYWTIVMKRITLIHLMVAFMEKQCRAGHTTYWQQRREVEQGAGEAASRLLNTLEHHPKLDHVKAPVERSDGEF